ncbi:MULTISPECIES: hypothetical protein [unclassified Lebetimonas]|uniref:hypothetical protein n=1 Tax=unclassified Lebetimonas TaxID=2648158 RepID=UPI0004653D61|nr:MULTISPECIES: hypothetical protein [unclassified Lebetimonas]
MNKENLKWKLKILFNTNYIIYENFLNFVKRKDILINKNSDILIEGFPRSGNTFAVALLKSLNKDIKIARHRHEVGHVLKALKLDKPIVILIRNPQDAVISFFLRENVSIKIGFEYYIHFYTNILKICKSSNLVLFNFDILIKEPKKFISIINEKYNFNLCLPDENIIKKAKDLVFLMDKEELKRKKNIYDISTFISMPSKKKKDSKEKIINEITNNIYLFKLQYRAFKIYEKIMEECTIK